jgi:hypothetical protein
MAPRQPQPGPFDQFLTPEAMLTPGVAGATAMMITNALGTNFSMSRAWTALALSFAFGLLSVVANKPLYTKMLFYVLNSLHGIGVRPSLRRRCRAQGDGGSLKRVLEPSLPARLSPSAEPFMGKCK